MMAEEAALYVSSRSISVLEQSDALIGGGHSGKAASGGVGQDRRQQRVFVGGTPGAQNS